MKGFSLLTPVATLFLCYLRAVDGLEASKQGTGALQKHLRGKVKVWPMDINLFPKDDVGGVWRLPSEKDDWLLKQARWQDELEEQSASHTRQLDRWFGDAEDLKTDTPLWQKESAFKPLNFSDYWSAVCEGTNASEVQEDEVWKVLCSKTTVAFYRVLWPDRLLTNKDAIDLGSVPSIPRCSELVRDNSKCGRVFGFVEDLSPKCSCLPSSSEMAETKMLNKGNESSIYLLHIGSK